MSHSLSNNSSPGSMANLCHCSGPLSSNNSTVRSQLFPFKLGLQLFSEQSAFENDFTALSHISSIFTFCNFLSAILSQVSRQETMTNTWNSFSTENSPFSLSCYTCYVFNPVLALSSLQKHVTFQMSLNGLQQMKTPSYSAENPKPNRLRQSHQSL